MSTGATLILAFALMIMFVFLVVFLAACILSLFNELKTPRCAICEHYDESLHMCWRHCERILPNGICDNDFKKKEDANA